MKLGERTRVYIGSATRRDGGIQGRWADYENRIHLPRYVAEALDEGFEITHMGLLI